jgi:hypothetical protein
VPKEKGKAVAARQARIDPVQSTAAGWSGPSGSWEGEGLQLQASDAIRGPNPNRGDHYIPSPRQAGTTAAGRAAATQAKETQVSRAGSGQAGRQAGM